MRFLRVLRLISSSLLLGAISQIEFNLWRPPKTDIKSLIFNIIVRFLFLDTPTGTRKNNRIKIFIQLLVFA